jgi:hypothetical protein
MKTQFKFTSSTFLESEAGEVALKKGMTGRHLAEFMASKLTGAGYRVLGIFPEPGGYAVELDNEQFPLRVVCRSLSEAPDSFLCAVDPSKSFVSMWFQRIPTSHIIGPLGDVVEQLLAPIAAEMQAQ